jgi:hypothetical protein
MIVLAGGFVGLYTVKYKVQAVKAEVAATERKLLEEKRNLRVLEAEWSYLNRPERLAQLSQKYLKLDSVSGIQLADYNRLPIGDTAEILRVAAAKAAKNPKPAASAVADASGVTHAR